jgi:hypothetical protein
MHSQDSHTAAIIVASERWIGLVIGRIMKENEMTTSDLETAAVILLLGTTLPETSGIVTDFLRWWLRSTS